MDWYSVNKKIGLNINIASEAEKNCLCKEIDSVDFSSRLFETEIVENQGKIKFSNILPKIKNRGNIIIGAIPYMRQNEMLLDHFIQHSELKY